MDFGPGNDADRIDAVAQPAAWVRQKIGGRKSQCPAEFLAGDDFADDRKGVTEQPRGTFGIACFECRAGRSRGGGLGVVRRASHNPLHDLNGNAMPFARFLEKGG